MTFVTEIKGKKCVAVTFERGVENFTSACGTGAVAAAAFIAKESDQEYEIKMPGGLLKVLYRGLNQNPDLVGPAQFDYEFETF